VDVPIVFDDEVYARMFVKALMVQLFNHKFDIDDLIVPELIEECHHRAFAITGSPNWSFLYSGEKAEVVRAVVDKVVPVKVMDQKTGAVRIKKGGKQVIARDLFLEHIVNASVPMEFKAFHKVLMEEAGLTNCGASTYLYNLKTEFGLTTPRAVKK
jgi:hypothetical protein